jgi:hypothetical protein
VQLTLIVIAFLVPLDDRIIPEMEYLQYAAILKQVDITAEILEDDDNVNRFLLECPGIDRLTVANTLIADENDEFNNDDIYVFETQGCMHGSGHEYVYNQDHMTAFNSNNTKIRNLPSYCRFTQFRRRKIIYRSFYSSNGKLQYFTIWAFPYNGSHLLKIDPVNRTIREVQVGKGDGATLTSTGYPRINSSIGQELSMLVHRCVLMLYGGPNNSGLPFSPSLVGDHKLRDTLDYAAMSLQLLKLAQNISKEANYNKAFFRNK